MGQPGTYGHGHGPGRMQGETRTEKHEEVQQPEQEEQEVQEVQPAWEVSGKAAARRDIRIRELMVDAGHLVRTGMRVRRCSCSWIEDAR